MTDHLLPDVIRIAHEAGAAIMEAYAHDIEVQRKADNSPVTQADMAAHQIIIRRLSALTPQWPALSEESDIPPATERHQWQTYWLIDPLDGTREFIKRTHEFTVNIALIHQHQPVLGVVYAPALQQLFYAASHSGAWRQTHTQAAHPIHTRPLDRECTVVATSRAMTSGPLRDFLQQLTPHHIISMGSSLKICLVAEGTADVYPRLGPTFEWDTAAAQCILEIAGGRLIGLDNHPFRYNQRDSLLNAEFFASGHPSYDWTKFLPNR